MTITAHLDLRLKADALGTAPSMLREILTETRAFAGCVGVDVIVDRADPTHLILVERWVSAEADALYRQWRAGAGASNLGSILAGPPVLTLFETVVGI